jgi:hypothetical protein
MALSVDTIYQRVLAILNKEQRGFVTPEEFNLFANQAQLDIFEQYFYDINQFGRMHGNDTEYSDMVNNLNEKISLFETEATLTRTGNYFVLPANLYRIGTVKAGAIEAERVNQNEYLYINASPLAKPTNARPVYTKSDSGIKAYGTAEYDTTGDINCHYVKKPAQVAWGYTTVSGSAQYNASTTTNFELHNSEETDLVIEILALCGLALKDSSVYQTAVGEKVRDTNEEKS